MNSDKHSTSSSYENLLGDIHLRRGWIYTCQGVYLTLEIDSPMSSERLAVQQALGLTAIVVREYEEALDFYVGVLGFVLVEDTPVPEQGKRWVVVSPPGAAESRLLLARASSEHQKSRIGNQTGGRVFLFLYTNDFWRDYNAYRAKGVTFVRDPKEEPYGVVAVFKDLYGNLWDLLQPKS